MNRKSAFQRPWSKKSFFKEMKDDWCEWQSVRGGRDKKNSEA